MKRFIEQSKLCRETFFLYKKPEVRKFLSAVLTAKTRAKVKEPWQPDWIDVLHQTHEIIDIQTEEVKFKGSRYECYNWIYSQTDYLRPLTGQYYIVPYIIKSI